MNEPKRIRLSRAKGWRKPDNAIVVGRPTPWGNPFVVGRDGDAEYCVELFENMIGGWLVVNLTPTISEQEIAVAYIKAHIEELRGKDLACWCRLDKPCHADVLLRINNTSLKCETPK
jgi:hypothetical protein